MPSMSPASPARRWPPSSTRRRPGAMRRSAWAPPGSRALPRCWRPTGPRASSSRPRTSSMSRAASRRSPPGFRPSSRSRWPTISPAPPPGRRGREGRRAAAHRPSPPLQPDDRPGEGDRRERPARPRPRAARPFLADEAGRLLRRALAPGGGRGADPAQPDPRRRSLPLSLRGGRLGSGAQLQCGAGPCRGGDGRDPAALRKRRARHGHRVGFDRRALELGAHHRREPGLSAAGPVLLPDRRHPWRAVHSAAGSLVEPRQARLVGAAAARARALRPGRSAEGADPPFLRCHPQGRDPDFLRPRGARHARCDRRGQARHPHGRGGRPAIPAASAA